MLKNYQSSSTWSFFCSEVYSNRNQICYHKHEHPSYV
nr:MAG TPA_asm: hypothetical protein [Bacteriophage sp.]